MKQIIGLLTALVFGSTLFQSCRDDEKDVVTESSAFRIDGLWVSKEGDEEIKYVGNRFYSTFTAISMSGTQEGTYNLTGDSKTGYKLMWDYSFLDMRVTTDFNITRYTDNSFSTSSDIAGATDYLKIKENIKLEAGGNKVFSKNADIKIIDTTLIYVEGNKIISSGKKGKTYIRVNDEDPYMIKVNVGTEEGFYDLWYEYANLLGQSIQTVRKELGNPEVWGTGSDSSEQCAYSGMRQTHGQINQVNFWFNEQDEVSQIQIFIKSSVTETQIRTYLREKYHSNIVEGNVFYFTSLPMIEVNKQSPLMYLIAYDIDANRITFGPYAEQSSVLWEDPNQLFGLTVDQTKEFFSSYELTHELEGALQYNVTDPDSYLSIISPRFYGPDSTSSSFLVQYKNTLDIQEVNNGLSTNCFLTKIETRGNGSTYYCFQSNDGTYGVTHNISTRVVTYFKMYWADYSMALSKTKDVIISMYGEASERDGTLIFGSRDNGNVTRVMMQLDDQQTVKSLTVALDTTVSSSVVINYLNLLYNFSNAKEDGSMYYWYDAPSFLDAHAMIGYSPQYHRISFLPLTY